MKTKLEKVIGKVGKLFKKDKSLERALRKVVGTKTLKSLMDMNNDWKLLPDEAAAHMNITVNELLQKAAESLHLPYIARVPSIDVDSIPHSVSFSDFRRLGCIPRVNNGSITAYICLDPQRAEMLFPAGTKLPLAIASWGSIQNALNQSETSVVNKMIEKEETKALQAIEAAKQALHLVFSQVKNYSVEELTINFKEENKITYNFLTKEQKNAEGSIHNRVRTGLLALLKKYTAEESSTLQLSDIAKHVMKVSDKADLYSISLLREEKKPVELSKVISFPEVAIRAEATITKSDVQRHIMIVDDSHIFAKVLEKFLAKLNVKTTYASNGKDAISKIRELNETPDLIICDLHMPEMNGCEFVKRIREELKMPELPIIILTSDDNVETELQLLTDGADAFIAKSEDPRLLCIKIEKMLEKVQKRKAA